MRNLFKFYPNKKGLFTGIYFSAFGLSAYFFYFLSKKIINPENNEFNKITNLYPRIIGENVPQYFLKTSLIIFISGILGSQFIYEYQDEDFESYLLEENKVNFLFLFFNLISLRMREYPLKIVSH